MRLSILGSGSSGNSALLVTDQTKVLIDAGLSARKLDKLLREAGERLEAIDAVFITHEHGDHSDGVESLKRHPRIQFFANSSTARAIQESLSYRPAWQIFETGSRFSFRDLAVRSFAVPHDAHDPVGFRFECGHEGDLFSPRRSLVWMTDLGHAPAHVHEHLRDCEVVAVEANHCPRMLQADVRRPWSTKQRISGRHGHLSNEAVRDLLAAIASPSWQRIYLTHLSRECNTPDAVQTALSSLRSSLRCEFSVVAPGQSTPLFEW
ncbi:MAG TPA: MBL fold metallo-hydrolase [Opitutaceae bacterium]|jgi:phosphoribosyl 1,2-cyclic phosphodiesterase